MEEKDKREFGPSLVQTLNGVVSEIKTKDENRYVFQLLRTVTSRDTGEEYEIRSRILSCKADGPIAEELKEAAAEGTPVNIRATAEQGISVDEDNVKMMKYYGNVLKILDGPCKSEECTLHGFPLRVKENVGKNHQNFVHLSLPKVGPYNKERGERENAVLSIPISPDMVEKCQQMIGTKKPITLTGVCSPLKGMPFKEDGYAPNPKFYGNAKFVERKPHAATEESVSQNAPAEPEESAHVSMSNRPY